MIYVSTNEKLTENCSFLMRECVQPCVEGAPCQVKTKGENECRSSFVMRGREIIC